MSGTRYTVEIRPVLPVALARLDELANDLYYSWDRGVRSVFRHLDPACWNECAHNPKLFLRRVPQARLDEAARDPMFLAEYRRALSAYDTYLEHHPNGAYAEHLDPDQDLIAYFSAEFGFHQSMPIYAGGLGILAADYCKAMSHLRAPFIGVGLLYQKGYFRQQILCNGDQQAHYPVTRPEDLPVFPAHDPDGSEIKVRVDIGGHPVVLKVWQVKVGHMRLYLLDSDLPENDSEHRSITHQLYGGDNHDRIRQEIVLGIGGVRALRALDLAPTVWHINEGHAAFLVVERCREEVAAGLPFAAALEKVAAATVFTTHTPVPAGHDIFDHGLVRAMLPRAWEDLGIDEHHFLSLGANPRSPGGFNMTSLALRGSRHHNGVSRIHGTVAADMERYVWPQIPPEENPLGYVTNGVDVSTFLGLAWASLFDMYLDGGWRARLTDRRFWAKFIASIPDHVFASVHQILKAELLEDCRRRVAIQYRRGGCPETTVARLQASLGPDRLNTLVIGFARRFATYKRATLLFRDLQRLERLVSDPERPVLFLFAGKAHPNDHPGQDLIREVFRISLLPQFLGRIILLEDYNFSMARRLMPGVDVWLNVPEYPKEACGTSGMKAAINGGINLSVLDGWWGEAYDGTNGWAITPKPEVDSEARNDHEAAELLDILEHQVVPLYFSRDPDGVPSGWIRRSKAAMQTTIPRFNSQRMALDYIRDYYGPAARQGRRMAAEDGARARALAQWKARVQGAWGGVQLRLAGDPPAAISVRESLPVAVAVHLNGLAPEEVVAECLIGRENALGEFVPGHSVRLNPEARDGDRVVYRADLCAGEKSLGMTGLQHYKVRVYPAHADLSHPFEHGCLLWL